MNRYEQGNRKSVWGGKWWVNTVILIVIMYIFWFVRGTHKERSNLYRSDAEEERITYTKTDMGRSAILGYSGVYWKGQSDYAKQACANQKSKGWKTVSQVYTEFPVTVRGQRTVGHFLFRCNERACGWRKIWPQLTDGRQNMAGVLKHQQRYLMDGKVGLRWKAVGIWR